MGRRLRLRWAPLLASLLACGVLAVPLSHVVQPHLRRWYWLRQLDSADAIAHRSGIEFVARTAHEDPRVVRAVIGRMRQANDERFRSLQGGLDRAGQWRCPPLPADVYLRWLASAASDPDREGRLLAAQRLGELGHLSGAPEIARRLAHLAADDDPDVRYNALIAAARLAVAVPASAQHHVDVIRAATADAETDIARHAWLLLGLVSPPGIPPPSIPALTAERRIDAALWCAARLNAQDRVIGVMLDRNAPPGVRGMAAYSLHGVPGAHWQTVIDELSNRDETNAVLLQRVVLSAPGSSAWPLELGPSDGSSSESWRPAAAHRCAAWLVGHPDHRWWIDASPLVRLAVWEGLAPGTARLDLDATTPDLHRLAGYRAVAKAPTDILMPLFHRARSELRDQACIAAAHRLDAQGRAALIDRLIGAFDDDAKMSGAILAGLCGRSMDVLERRVEIEDAWAVRQVQRLGLWMGGRLEMHPDQVRALLAQERIPASTVLLALLHRDPNAGLTWLLNPEGEPPVDLVELLVRYRWWYVLESFLPEDAPPLWLWADANLQHLQLDVLRNWHLLALKTPRQ